MKRLFVILMCISFLVTGCHKETKTYDNASAVSENEVLMLPTVLNASDYSSLSENKIGWGFKKNINQPPEIPAEWDEMLTKYDGVYMDKKADKVLYLTFDEGYENGYTDKILDILKENDVKAAFFITMPYLEKSEDLVRRMVEEGHTVGNHSVNHPSLPEITDAQTFSQELLKLDEAFKARFGQTMKYLRAPRGEFSEKSLAMSRDLGYINVMWSFAYKDWDTKAQRGEEYAYKQITDGVFDGCIMLLHAVSKDNAQVLDRVIKDLKTQGYQFKSLDEMAK